MDHHIHAQVSIGQTVGHRDGLTERAGDAANDPEGCANGQHDGAQGQPHHGLAGCVVMRLRVFAGFGHELTLEIDQALHIGVIGFQHRLQFGQQVSPSLWPLAFMHQLKHAVLSGDEGRTRILDALQDGFALFELDQGFDGGETFANSLASFQDAVFFLFGLFLCFAEDGIAHVACNVVDLLINACGQDHLGVAVFDHEVHFLIHPGHARQAQIGHGQQQYHQQTKAKRQAQRDLQIFEHVDSQAKFKRAGDIVSKCAGWTVSP